MSYDKNIRYVVSWWTENPDADPNEDIMYRHIEHQRNFPTEALARSFAWKQASSAMYGVCNLDVEERMFYEHAGYHHWEHVAGPVEIGDEVAA